jgi:hypothetical protein
VADLGDPDAEAGLGRGRPGVGLGLAAVALDLFPYAGVQRLLLGAAWTAIGYRLWRGRPEREPVARRAGS